MSTFDPAEHRLAETRYFEDFALGERFVIPSRTVAEAHFLAFQAASGDNHPIHYDREYCKRLGHRDLLAHGYQVLIQTAAGAGMLPHLMEESMIGVELPPTVDLKVVETAPGIKGATAANQRKPATLETGLVVQVPPFIEEGEMIRVNTTDSSYSERAK